MRHRTIVKSCNSKVDAVKCANECKIKSRIEFTVRWWCTLCSKKCDAKIQITITTAYLIRIKYPLSGFSYHFVDVNVTNFNKSTAQFLSNSCFKNGTQKQKFLRRCGACSSNASTVAGFATSTTWNGVSSRSGVASTRTSLTEQFDSGVFDDARVSVQTAATLSTNCNWCFCVRTTKATLPYWKLLFLSSIIKTAVA